MLIEPSEVLASHRLFDCRSSLADHEAGRRLYEAAHLPGALFADLEQDLSSTPGPGGRHPLPDRETFAETVRRWGLRNDSRIVCYDQNNGAFAARLWWMLRWLGHAEVRVLNGGLDAWREAGLPVTSEPTLVGDVGDFQAGPPLTRTRQAGELADSGCLLLDARDRPRFLGEVEPIDPVAGHIPGAICAPFADNLNEGRFRSAAELKSRFTTLGVSPDTDVVCYCGSGVTAAHNILALLVAGFDEPALYPGSWSEWITDPERPIATGDA